MSLVSQAIVSTTKYLLKDATWADRILEQPIDPISYLLRPVEEPAAPVIAVYVEQERSNIIGRDTFGRDSEIDLKIIVYISPGKVKLPPDPKIKDEQDAERWAFELVGLNDAGKTLNVVARQVDCAFHLSGSLWHKLWKRFISKFTERIERYLLVEIENGVKIPAIEITYRAHAIPEPDVGVPLYGAWLELDQALREDGGEKEILADIFKMLIEEPSGLPSFVVFQNNFGLTDAGLVASGLGPFMGVTDEETGEPAVLEGVEIDGDVTVQIEVE